MEKTKKALAEAEAAKKTADENLKKADAELEKANLAKQEADKKVSEARANAEASATELETANKNLKKATSVLEEKKAALKKLEEQYANGDAIENARKELEEAKTAYDAAEKSLKEKTAKVEAEKSEVNAKKAEADAKDEAFNKAKEKKEKAAGEAEKAKDAYDKANDELSEIELIDVKAKKRLKDAKEAKAEADKAVEKAEKELEDAKNGSGAGSALTVEEAQAKVEEAKSKVEASKKEAKQQWNKGSRGFFEKQVWTYANSVYEKDVKNTNDINPGKKMVDYTKMGADGDATSLDNLKLGIEIVKLINEKRKLGGKNGEALDPYKISPEFMAITQVTANWVDGQDGLKHPDPGMMVGGENISSSPDPNWTVNAWYSEISIYKEAVKSGKYPNLENMSAMGIYLQYPELYFQIGHYLNIVMNDHNAVGAAASKSSAQENGSDANAVSVQEFEKAFEAYYGALKDVLSNGSAEAKAALDEADKELEKAKKAVAEKEALIKEAQKNLAEKQETAKKKEALVKGAESEVAKIEARKQAARAELSKREKR